MHEKAGRNELLSEPLLPLCTLRLLTDSELLDQSTVSVDVLLRKVVKKVTSAANHLEKTSSGVVVIVMVLEMSVEVVDSLCENCDLNLGGTCVVLAELVSFDDCVLFFLEHHNKYTSFKNLPVNIEYGRYNSPAERYPYSK